MRRDPQFGNAPLHAIALLLIGVGCAGQDEARFSESTPPVCDVPNGTVRDPDIYLGNCRFRPTGITVFKSSSDLETEQGRNLQRCLSENEDTYNLDEINFDQSKLIVVASAVGSTCGLETRRAQVIESSTRVGIEHWTWDHSGGCEVVCLANGANAFGVLVARELEVIDCTFTGDACRD